jgi:UPF0755 protein
MAEPTENPKESVPEQAKGFSLFRKPSLRSPSEALQPDTPPPPPPPKKPRRTGTLALVRRFLSFLLVAAVGAIAGVVYVQQKLRSVGPLQQDRLVYIAPRTDVPEILAQLEREGVIDAPVLMNVSLLLEGNRGNVKAGEYLFKREASLREVMDLLVSGRQFLHAITIPEGLTTEQIIQRLRENDLLAGDLREAPREGMLLPETYRVPRGMSRNDLFRKMQEDQRRLIDQIWAKRDPSLPLRTPHELVTLASIVEKETGRADERARVAGVFVNRLNKRMRLQSDPTIVYGIVGGKGTLGRGITRAEINQATPYNTYVIDGLPPGPIANPGRASLEAVANPIRTADLFFVADGTGGHAFAETLEQHNRNVARWRQIERDRAESGVDRAPAIAPGEPAANPPNAAPPRGQRGSLERQAPAGPLGDALERVADVDLRARFGLRGVLPSGPPPSRLMAAQVAERKLLAQRSVGNLAMFEFGPGVDSLPPLRGFAERPQLDGTAEDFDMGLPMPGDVATYPVSPERLADQRARAARLGIDLPPLPGASALPAEALALQSVHEVTRRRVLDASEGTALDPLKNRSWDLSTPKRVPEGIRASTAP